MIFIYFIVSVFSTALISAKYDLSPMHTPKECVLLLLQEVLCMFVRSHWLTVSFKFSVSLQILCLLVLAITVKISNSNLKIRFNKNDLYA